MRIKKTDIYSLVLCLYIGCTVVTDTGSMPMKLVRVVLAGVWGLKILFDKKVKFSAYALRMMPFCVFAALSVLWADNTEFAADMGQTLVINVVCICAVIELIDGRKEQVDLALKTMAIAPLLLEVRVIMAGGLFAYMNDRWAGTISGNVVGLCAAFGACIALYYFVRGVKAYGLLFLVNVAIVALSASRKALICVCIPFVFLYLFDTKIDVQKRRARFAALAFVGMVGMWMIMCIPFLYDLIGSRIEGMLAMMVGNKAVADPSARSRSQLISWGFDWFAERPLMGFGIDNYRYVLHSRHSNWSIEYYAHNNYVELLVDTGIIGVILYYWNYAQILAQFIKNGRRVDNAALVIVGLFVALVIDEWALVSYFDKYVQALLAVIWCFALQLQDSGEKEIDYARHS